MTKAITRSGRIVDLLNPQPDTISADDVAWHLAHEIRWNGQLGELTVAQHSVEVSRIVEPVTPLTRLLALLHEGDEFLYGDVVSPAKLALFNCAGRSIDAWSTMTHKLGRAVYIALAGRTPTQEEQAAIDEADRVVAKWEAWMLGSAEWKDAIEKIAPGYFEDCGKKRPTYLTGVRPIETAYVGWKSEYETLKNYV